VPDQGNDSRCALGELTAKPATWFEFVEDSDLIAFKQPLLIALAQSVAIGELVGGPDAGTIVVIPTSPPDDAGAPRFTHDEAANAFVED
jgi:hypothetical protein